MKLFTISNFLLINFNSFTDGPKTGGYPYATNLYYIKLRLPEETKICQGMNYGTNETVDFHCAVACLKEMKLARVRIHKLLLLLLIYSSHVNGCVTSRLFTVPGRYWKTSDVPGRRQRLLHCEYFTKHLSSNCDFLNFLLYKIHQIDFCFIFGWCKFADWLRDTSKLPTRTN